MSESNFWKTLRKNLKGRWRAERIENAAGVGTPDVYYTIPPGHMGWTELKFVDKIPKRSSTVVKIEHFTPQQKNFINRHGRIGANVSVFLKIERDYMIFDWSKTEILGLLTYSQLLSNSSFAWNGRLNYDELLEALTNVNRI